MRRGVDGELSGDELRWELEIRSSVLAGTRYVDGDAWRADQRAIARGFLVEHLDLDAGELCSADLAAVERIAAFEHGVVADIVRLALLSRRGGA